MSPPHRTLLFQRKESIYALPLAEGIRPRPHPVVDLSGVKVKREGEPAPAWFASANGERIVYISDRESDLLIASAGAEPWMERIPSAVRCFSLAGQRQNRLLFTLPGQGPSYPESHFSITPHALRNAKGQAVVRFSSEGNEEDDDVGNWFVVGVTLCSTIPRLLVTLRRIMPTTDPIEKTCAVELRHNGGCVAVTDRKGRWCVQSAVRDISERDGMLTGVTWSWTKNFLRYYYVHVAAIDGRSTERSLLPATFDSKHEPPCAHASSPSLAPDLRTIAFVSGGIWLVDCYTRRYLRLTNEPDIRQLAWESPTSLLVLKGINDREDAPTNLYRVALDRHYHLTHRPARVMENVDRFQLLDTAL